MDKPAHQSETEDRRSAMLRTAFCSVVREALEAPDTIEIMANPDGSVWIETTGIGVVVSDHRLAPSDRERVIRLVASGVGEAANRNSPIVSAELPGSGERFEGLLPPVSTSPCFSIRKPATTPFKLADYVDQGALAPAIMTALKAAVSTHDNILIAGGTSSGKTTFTNALLTEPSLHDDRIVILEDTRELKCTAPNTVQLRTHRGATNLQDLVRSTLRLRPDRIIVGEVRGAEALDLLKAWNTGHPGGITTLHANSAHGALQRLEQLTLEATPRAPFDLIAEAIDVVVFMSRAGGQRRVEEALRVTGFNGEGYDTAPLVSRSLSLVQHGETL
ncbi:P-type conjugative transfer ATPase TrbB [Hyphomonas pacifica]|uniref:P-type conjugative transfer ATPase TrbB n=2 Tax=Hyphomonas pacifica TaxID=1280941 RepID=UPI00049F24F9|nr:P-type conjugative transfer ATPase TrbB [Hyphomonas pacifica]KCZ49304.1 conjugal transfer protein TrbB [Hyphomonas pacifica]